MRMVVVDMRHLWVGCIVALKCYNGNDEHRIHARPSSLCSGMERAHRPSSVALRGIPRSATARALGPRFDDDSSLEIIGLTTSILDAYECVGECRIGGKPPVSQTLR